MCFKANYVPLRAASETVPDRLETVASAGRGEVHVRAVVLVHKYEDGIRVPRESFSALDEQFAPDIFVLNVRCVVLVKFEQCEVLAKSSCLILGSLLIESPLFCLLAYVIGYTSLVQRT